MVTVLSLSNQPEAGSPPARYKIGDVITFPEHIGDVKLYSTIGQIKLIEVKKNGNYWLFPIHYIRQVDINLQPIHPVSKELRPCKNDYERILALLGRKITLTEIKKCRMMKLKKDKTISKRCAIKECYIWDFVD
jgi:hypothetical protein